MFSPLLISGASEVAMAVIHGYVWGAAEEFQCYFLTSDRRILYQQDW
jgi:hypothetical protein